MTLPNLIKTVFWVAVVTVLYVALAPASQSPEVFMSDKVLHFAAFVALSGLAAVAFGVRRPVRLGFLLSAFGALIEFLQGLPLFGRDMSFGDWVADTVAVVLTLGALWLVGRRRPALTQAD